MDPLSSLVLAIVVVVVGFIVLAGVIRTAVRKGVEDVLYKQNPDKTWSAHPWLLAAVQQAVAEATTPDAAPRRDAAPPPDAAPPRDQ
ncbi:hypothetical protein [Herbiconiux flava]|uniref:Uncharacterized protein n=1 Tax=Herbiconiux flava TaxID=881268 RepID=A0A852SN14_9MICO|nr:hypothetical protein [Herbiconiux flava]NYD70218.1 hypothetical protein [Herbiconiux flava]GLK16970.1 hypothetical protein GCM10017602_14520 [Herbiconiux flava]